jgi:hypothetical protein
MADFEGQLVGETGGGVKPGGIGALMRRAEPKVCPFWSGKRYFLTKTKIFEKS